MRSKIVVSSVFALLLTGISASALAQDSGFFINGTIGSTEFEAGGLDTTETSFGFSGGYDINQNFAIAIGYDNFGSISDPTGSIDIDGFNIRVIGTVPINDTWSVFGLAGNQHWEADASVGPFTASADGDELLLGVGGKAQVSDVFSIIGGYSFFEINNGVDVGTLYLGGEYSFH